MAVNSPMKDYTSAKHDYDLAVLRLEKWGRELGKAGVALLTKPHRFGFSSGPAANLPPDALTSDDSVLVSANDWPTTGDILKQLGLMHEALRRLADAWKRLPPHERDSLKELPEAAKLLLKRRR